MKVFIAGDYYPNERVADVFKRGDYASVFSDLKPIVENTDYSIVNLECPVIERSAYPIEKLGPSLRCSISGIEALKYLGVNCVTLANNHFLDYGEDGVKDSIKTLDSFSVEHVGGGMDLVAASKTLYKAFNGRKLAIINCCEHEFSIATSTSAGCNPLNPIRQYYSIQEAKHKADKVLVIVHGGHEHFQLPSPRMVEMYRFFIDAGADAVVNHHQHCFSGYEVYNGKPIFYGLGNFCFDSPQLATKEEWYYGYMVAILFEERKIKFKILPYIQCKNISLIQMRNDSFCDSRLSVLNSIICDQKSLKKYADEYYKKSMRTINIMLEPFTNRFLQSLQFRGILPSFYFSRIYLLRLYNFLFCESHRDKVFYFLKEMSKKR